MQSARVDRAENMYTPLPRAESVYSNIDPLTGAVDTREDAVVQYHKMMMISTETLAPRYHKRSRWSLPSLKQRLKHLGKPEFILKVVEFFLLAICGGLYVNDVHNVLHTFHTILFPMVVNSVFFIYILGSLIVMASKIQCRPIMMVIVNTLAVIIISSAGGVILGVWFQIPRKVVEVLYWPSKAILAQSLTLFLCAAVFLVDLACSLETLNTQR